MGPLVGLLGRPMASEPIDGPGTGNGPSRTPGASGDTIAGLRRTSSGEPQHEGMNRRRRAAPSLRLRVAGARRLGVGGGDDDASAVAGFGAGGGGAASIGSRGGLGPSGYRSRPACGGAATSTQPPTSTGLEGVARPGRR